jgi:hypothetical protein
MNEKLYLYFSIFNKKRYPYCTHPASQHGKVKIYVRLNGTNGPAAPVPCILNCSFTDHIYFCPPDFDVNIQLPPKGSAKEEIITITGLEADALAAKDEILKEIRTDD